jgi:hypothetical protein
MTFQLYVKRELKVGIIMNVQLELLVFTSFMNHNCFKAYLEREVWNVKIKYENIIL